MLIALVVNEGAGVAMMVVVWRVCVAVVWQERTLSVAR